jgi:hypothetical protein
MPRGEYAPLSVEAHYRAIEEIKQSGSGGRITAGIPVYAADIHQIGNGFFGDIWTGLKTFGETLYKTGTQIIKDIINPGVNIKKTIVKRTGEATSHLLDQAEEAYRRRRKGGTKRTAAAAAASGEDQQQQQQGSGRKRKRTMRKLQYIICPSGKTRSVRGRKRRKQGRVQKKKKQYRRKTAIKRRQQQQKQRRRRRRITTITRRKRKTTKGSKRGRRKRNLTISDLGF